MTGMRRGEILGLRWEDVDLDAGVLRVSGALQRIDGELRRAAPKTRQSRRPVSLPAQVVVALQAHRARQREERLAVGPDWVNSGYVFASTVGTPIDPRNLTRTFEELIAKTQVRRVRFHDQRHCFATLQLANNVPARVVMEELGHTQISTTLDVYSHVTQTLHREAADRLGALFAG
jgi:integrase